MPVAIHGPGEIKIPGGTTVGRVRDAFAQVLNIPPDAEAIVNGHPVQQQYVVQDEDTLFFVRASGRKGADRFFTAGQLQEVYRLPPHLFSKLLPDLPPAYHDEEGTTFYLESMVDDFLHRWASGEANPSPYFTAKEAAAYIRTTVQGIYSLVKRGRLTPLPGRHSLTFTREQLDKCVRCRR